MMLTCRKCGRLVDPWNADPAHDVVFRYNVPGSAGGGTGREPYMVLHSPWHVERPKRDDDPPHEQPTA